MDIAVTAPAERGMTVEFIPSSAELAPNPYWMLLRNGLEGHGVVFGEETAASFTLRSLWHERSRPRLFHFHYIQHLYAYEGRWARMRWVLRFGRNLMLARALGHRLIFTLHNLTPTYPLEPVWVDRLGHRLMIAAAHRVIVHCERARALLAETYGRRRGVDVVAHPNFIGVYPDTMSREAARKSFGFCEDEIVLVFVGGLRPNKGLDGLLRAFRQVDDSLLRLLIAGSPGQASSLVDELRAAAADDPRIHLRPERVPDDEIQRYMRAADAVVLPFARILTSSTVMLALSFSRPVIAPRMGCLTELPDDVALTYAPDDDSALPGILSGIHSIDLASMGARASAYALRFSPEAFVRQTMNVYHRVAT